MRVAVEIKLNAEERATLERWARGRSTPARQVFRAKIVLMAADGRMNKEMFAALETDAQTVKRWRTRFAERGLAGLIEDAPRGGRKPSTREKLAPAILKKTTQEKPKHATHWSTRTLAQELGTSRCMVQRVWKAAGLKPHRVKTLKLSNDPHFVEKLLDVVGRVAVTHWDPTVSFADPDCGRLCRPDPSRRGCPRSRASAPAP